MVTISREDGDTCLPALPQYLPGRPVRVPSRAYRGAERAGRAVPGAGGRGSDSGACVAAIRRSGRGDGRPRWVYRGAMRAKRTRTRPGATPGGEDAPDATGQTIDWIGTQATGGGGASVLPEFVVGGLAALRAAPFLARKAARRLRSQAAAASSTRSGEGSGSAGAASARDLREEDK